MAADHFERAFLLILVGIQARIYYRQWTVMQEQVGEMKKSTDAATKAAKAAEDSVALARESTHLDQRAWIGVTNIQGTPEIDKPWTVVVTLKNSGKTFARRVKLMIVATLDTKPYSPGLFIEDDEKAWTRNAESIVAPNSETLPITDFNNSMKITQSHLDQINSGQITAFVHGKVIYWDVFDCQHWLTFCGRYDPIRKSYSPCDEHNDTDNNRCP